MFINVCPEKETLIAVEATPFEGFIQRGRVALPVTEEHHVCPARALSAYLSDLGKAVLFCVLQCHSQPLVPWKKHQLGFCVTYFSRFLM